MNKKLRRFILLFIAIILMFNIYPINATVEVAVEKEKIIHNEKSSVDEKYKENDEEPHSDTGHKSPVTPILLGMIIILLTAKLGGELFERMDQPAVLGELIGGVIIGNIALFTGFTYFEFLKGNEIISVISELAVIILLFQVGLESDIDEMLKVGWTSFAVAVVGVIAPFILGYGTSYFFMPDATIYVHLFIGATLTATSVGITARVFQDLGKLRTKEAKIILGAAVIDDVLGLVILAEVAGIINSGGKVNIMDFLKITGSAVAFLVISVSVGLYIGPRIGKVISKFKVKGMKLTTALCAAFFLSYLANLIDLAPIVGAFAAGLIIDESHFEAITHEYLSIEELIKPVSVFLVPIFFVLMGVQVKLETFANVQVLSMAAGLTLAAILGKQVCGFVVPKGIDGISVGLGMIPRGEVGLIFAAYGMHLFDPVTKMPVIDSALFSATVIMVIVTTLVTPMALKWSLFRHEKTI